MADAFEILSEIAFHLNGHPVLQQVLFLGHQFRGQIPETLLGILTVGGAAEIHLGVQDPLPAFFAAAGGIVFKELHLLRRNWGTGSQRSSPGFQ